MTPRRGIRVPGACGGPCKLEPLAVVISIKNLTKAQAPSLGALGVSVLCLKSGRPSALNRFRCCDMRMTLIRLRVINLYSSGCDTDTHTHTQTKGTKPSGSDHHHPPEPTPPKPENRIGQTPAAAQPASPRTGPKPWSQHRTQHHTTWRNPPPSESPEEPQQVAHQRRPHISHTLAHPGRAARHHRDLWNWQAVPPPS